MLLILCVDGLDYDMAVKEGHHRKVKYYKKLDIPIECYVKIDGVLMPHTTRIWPSMFSGTKVDYGYRRRGKLRQYIHDKLVDNNIIFRKGKKEYTVNPYNIDLDIVFDHYNSFIWNIPTISPESICKIPDHESLVKYFEREYLMFNFMVYGVLYASFDVVALYTRYLDYLGHHYSNRLRDAYCDIFGLVDHIKEKCDYIIISDHGCIDGVHTNNAFVGSSMEVEADSVEQIRGDIERILNERARIQ